MIKKTFSVGLRALAASLLLTSLSIGLSDSATAGANDTQYYSGSCGTYGGSMAYCYGSMAGIRAQSFDPNAMVQFTMDSNGTLGFLMRSAGIQRSCTTSASITNMRDMWIAAVNNGGYFWVEFDLNTGWCTTAYIAGASNIKNESAL